ncbi:polysaccharide deacetylase family protein [Mesorhizobium opportunistum]|uniref:polysaccharide deacetylase family protein n=1 Tax=Mesorhizobium opportunistum TaxID=593909 RepID=UPI0033362B6C
MTISHETGGLSRRKRMPRPMTSFWFVLAAVLMSVLPAHGADRTIYLTFDEGPLSGTVNILDVLQASQVPATLFMVGMHAEASASNKMLVRRAKAMPLVTIGNHSYSHAYNHYRHFYGDTEGVVADMLKANAVLGLKPAVQARLPGRDVFRLPSMSKDDNSLGPAQAGREDPDYEFVAASGFYLYGWDHEWVHKGAGADRRPSGQRNRPPVRLRSFRQTRQTDPVDA